METILSLMKFWEWDYGSLLFTSLLMMLASLLILIAIAKLFNCQVKHCNDFSTRFDGKTIVMTGAIEGLGKEAAKQFLSRGARVVIGCRSPHRAMQAKDDILRGVEGCGSLELLPLDLSSMTSVRAFAGHVIKTEKRLDVLVLNGSSAASRTKLMTDEGFERTLAENYLGHFLLTNLLFGLLKVTYKSSIIVGVSSIYTFLRTINPDDLMFEKERYTTLRANALSKVCLVLFTRHFAILALRYGVVMNCFCPGFLRVQHYDKSVDVVTRTLRQVAGMLIGRTAIEGSQTLMYLATSVETACGTAGYFVDCRSREVTDLVSNDGLAKKVFEATEDMVKLTQHEKRYI